MGKIERHYDYLGYDALGYWVNTKYPPDYEKYGYVDDGYRNFAESMLFFYFAVLGYDIEFHYRGKIYHLVYDWDHAALCDEHYTVEYERFENPNVLIEQLEVEGKKLIDIIDDLDYIEAV